MTELTPIELATGVVFGVNPLRLPAATTTPPQALEAAVRPALQRGRCFVSFSGGRDSSPVLAAAAAVARREGLAAPVPSFRTANGAVLNFATWPSKKAMFVSALRPPRDFLP